MLATSTANTSTGVPTKHPLTVRAWTPGQHPTTLDYCMTQREQPVSPLTGETSAPALCGQTMYPTWTSQELCAMLAQRVRDPLSHRFIRATVGTDSDRAASSLLFRLQQKKQKRWEETVNSIAFSHFSFTSRTLVARRGAPSTNSLAGLGAPFACAPSRQIPSSRNLWRTGHTRLGTASLPGLSARSCPVYGRSQHQRVTASLTLLGQRSLLPPSGAWGQENLRVWVSFSWTSYSTPGWLSNLGFAISSLLACANSKFQMSGEEH